MSNLFKSINIISNKTETKIIDNNPFILKKITQTNKMTLCCTQEEESDNFINGIEFKTLEAEEYEEKESSDIIVENAKAQADTIINQALIEAEKIKKDAVEKGKKEAYELALKEAGKEIERIKQELEAKRIRQEDEYNKRLQEMEPILVDAILQVFNNVTHVLTEDKKDMILYLVNSVMTKTEIGRNFIIKVSKEDYVFMINNKEKIYGALVKDTNIEVIEDLTLKRNQCIIETDSGIYDCSLDIQLENLIRDIKTLACMLD